MDTGEQLAFGDLLRQYRNAAGLTQEDLAAHAGLNPDTISLLERGERRRPHRFTTQSLAAALGLSPQELIRFETAARVPAFQADAHEVPPSDLPSQLTPFIGREREVDEVMHRLLHPDVRLLTLTGPGGVGKTRLGLEVARRVLDRFDEGVSFVALAPGNEPNLVPSAIARALGVRRGAGQSMTEALEQHLRERQQLLLLDNFERLLDAGALLTRLLGACPRLKVLVTSRVVLHLRGEHRYQVPAMALPPTGYRPSTEVDRYEGIHLFAERARAAKSDFEVTAGNAPVVIELCRKLDGLPLAIELAAARVGMLPPEAMLARLGNSLALLTDGARDLPDRQRTLRATLDWSYDLLDTGERSLFAHLAVFVGGWTLDAAEAVCDVGDKTEVLRQLSALVDKSLVQQTNARDEPRFTMLETVREYALERLGERGEAERFRRRHAGFFLRLAEEEERASRGPLQRVWLDRLEAEHDNLRAALEWSLTSQNDTELGLQLAGALSHFWYVREYHSESRVWLERALKIGGGAAAHARVLVSAGRLAWFQGEFARVNTLVEESLTLYRQLGDDAGAAFALLVLGRTAVSQGNLVRGQTLVEESLGLFRQLGNRWGIARAFIVLGDRNLFEGVVAKGESRFRTGLEIARDLQDAEGVALSLLYLGRAAHLRGDEAHASTRLEESLTVFEGSNDSRGVAEVLLEMGRVAHARGKDEQALTLCRRSLDRSRKLENKTQIAFCLMLAGEILASRDTARATSLFGAAEALLRSLDAALDPGGSLGYGENLANAQTRLGEESFAKAWQRGKTMTIGKAMDEVEESGFGSDPPAPGFTPGGV